MYWQGEIRETLAVTCDFVLEREPVVREHVVVFQAADAV